MVRKRRLTAGRMADRRFRRTEKLILELFSRGFRGSSPRDSRVGFRSADLSVDKMMKKIGRSRATFYLHHGGVFEVVGDFEEYILGEYRRELRRFKGSLAGEVVYGSLVFMVKNREIFWMLIERSGGRVFEGVAEEMLECFRGSGSRGADFRALPEVALAILKGEVATVFREWTRAGFPEGKMRKVVRDVVWLIDTAKGRLDKIDFIV